MIAFYILFVFVAGHGGILDNIKKVSQIQQIETKKITGELELENLKSKLYYLQSLKIPDFSILAQQGKKVDNMIIFKYINRTENQNNIKEKTTDLYKYRIYFSSILVFFLLITGNILICINMNKRV